MNFRVDSLHGLAPSVDHVIPKSAMRSDRHAPWNLLPAHRACNSAREHVFVSTCTPEFYARFAHAHGKFKFYRSHLKPTPESLTHSTTR
jgi:hypothetical protein